MSRDVNGVALRSHGLGVLQEKQERVWLIVATVKNEKKEALPGDAQTIGENVDSAEAKGRLAATMIAERLPTALEPTVVEESGVFEVQSKAGRTLALVECHPMMLHADLGGEYTHAETVRLVAYELGVSFACMDRL
jgi:hypothetical protein